MYNSFINLAKERERDIWFLSVSFLQYTRIVCSRILDSMIRWPIRSLRGNRTPRWRTVFTQGISVLSNRNALPHCVLSPDCLFGKQRQSVDGGRGRGNRYRMVLRFHSNNNHLSLSLSLFRASANDAAMRRLASIKIRRVNIINRDGLRILPETG